MPKKYLRETCPFMSIFAAVREIILTIQRKPENHLPKLKYYSKYRVNLFYVHCFFSILEDADFARKFQFHILCLPPSLYIHIYICMGSPHMVFLLHRIEAVLSTHFKHLFDMISPSSLGRLRLLHPPTPQKRSLESKISTVNQ